MSEEGEKVRVAVVTGGTGGLGTAICRAMSAQGHIVVALHSPGHSDAQGWLNQQALAGFPVASAEADVGVYASCVAASNDIRKRFGPISILVNNAGITRDASFQKMTQE